MTASVEVGLSVEQVEELLGTPASVSQRPDRALVYRYAAKKVTFRDGKVVLVQNQRVVDDAPRLPGSIRSPGMRTSDSEEGVETTPGSVLCPYCKGQIDDDALKCKHCGEWVKERLPVAVGALPGEFVTRAGNGSPLRSPASPIESHAASEPGAAAPCQWCHKLVQPTASVCPHCAKPPRLRANDGPQKSSPQLDGSFRPIALAVGIFLLLLMLMVVARENHDSGADRAPSVTYSVLRNQDGSSAKIILWASKDAFDACMAERNAIGRSGPICNGVGYVLEPPERKIEIIDFGILSLTKLRVLEGVHAGFVGWVPGEFIGTSR